MGGWCVECRVPSFEFRVSCFVFEGLGFRVSCFRVDREREMRKGWQEGDRRDGESETEELERRRQKGWKGWVRTSEVKPGGTCTPQITASTQNHPFDITALLGVLISQTVLIN